MSIACFLVYYADKRSARSGAWRVPENVLHFFELCGGWPGAFIAQRVLRHKSSKGSYLFTYWPIVQLYQYIGYDGPRDWLIAKVIAAKLRELSS